MNSIGRMITSLVLCALFASSHIQAAERLEITYGYIVGKARELAQKAYDDNWGQVPDFLRELGYDAYHQIRFVPLKALWEQENLPFRIQFNHPGSLYDRALTIYEFTNSHVQEIRFVTDFFDYGNNESLANQVPADLGYAGFHVLYPLNKANLFEETAVFLGSNYFRVLARGNIYGLSTRCLALNTTTGEKEEFPQFREFWLGKPQPTAENLVVYALLDSPSVTGACRFDLYPGEITRVEVRQTLFFRKEVKQVGIAPSSSMFYFGENTLHKPPDYRPEVHDSDGLLLQHADGTWRWRPLINPPDKRISTFPCEKPISFGLRQRDREFSNYQDIHAAYHRRPGLWVEFGDGAPGAGAVVLYEFHVENETVDNVVAFWQPDKLPVAGESLEIDYTLKFCHDPMTTSGVVVATRTGRPILSPELYECVVDFAGGELSKLEEVDKVKAAVATSDSIRLEGEFLEKNPYNGTWRLFLQFAPKDPSRQGTLNAYLKHGENRLTETWSYLWQEK